MLFRLYHGPFRFWGSVIDIFIATEKYKKNIYTSTLFYFIFFFFSLVLLFSFSHISLLFLLIIYFYFTFTLILVVVFYSILVNCDYDIVSMEIAFKKCGGGGEGRMKCVLFDIWYCEKVTEKKHLNDDKHFISIVLCTCALRNSNLLMQHTYLHYNLSSLPLYCRHKFVFFFCFLNKVNFFSLLHLFCVCVCCYPMSISVWKWQKDVGKGCVYNKDACVAIKTPTKRKKLIPHQWQHKLREAKNWNKIHVTFVLKYILSVQLFHSHARKCKSIFFLFLVFFFFCFCCYRHFPCLNTLYNFNYIHFYSANTNFVFYLSAIVVQMFQLWNSI